MDGRFHYVAKLRQLSLLAVLLVSLLMPVTATARCHNPGATASRFDQQVTEEQALTAKTAYTGVFDPGEKRQIGLLRWYDPNLQRWINRDPMGENGGINLYQFVRNNPISLVDPYGLDYTEVPAPFGSGNDYPYYYGDTFGEDVAAIPYNVGAAFAKTVEGAFAFGDWALGKFFGQENAEAAAMFFWGRFKKPGGPITVGCPTQRAARRAAERLAGMGKNGPRVNLPSEPFTSGSLPRTGSPGVRTSIQDPYTGNVVHHDPYGHLFPGGSTIPPHYGAELPGGTVHFTYPSPHDPSLNR